MPYKKDIFDEIRYNVTEVTYAYVPLSRINKMSESSIPQVAAVVPPMCFTASKQEIIKRIPTPLHALHAMITGIKRWADRPDCYIYMSTYGRKVDRLNASSYEIPEEKYSDERPVVCCGCAATATVFNIFEDDPNDVVRQSMLSGAITSFEYVIDMVRRGSIINLFPYYYGEDPKQQLDWLNALRDVELRYYEGKHIEYALPTITTENWEESIKLYQLFARHYMYVLQVTYNYYFNFSF